MTQCTLLLVGCGNVGAGIAAAFVRSGRWSVTIVDPCADLVPPEHTLLPCSIDELSDEQLAEQLAMCDEIVYAAECGNRDEYAARPEMARENCERFERFARRVASLGSGAATRHIAYVGGSWTRREARVCEGRLLVGDDTPAKADAEANAYERAKTAALATAQALAASERLQITFVDWISVVPNLAPNFTVAKMVAAALDTGVVRFSAGDFGRPLLSGTNAGHALLLLTEKRRLESAAAPVPGCSSVLMPGHFTTFHRFAEIVQEAVTASTQAPPGGVTLEPVEDGTPAALAARCESEQLATTVGFVPDAAAVDEGLRETARAALHTLPRRKEGGGPGTRTSVPPVQ